MRVCVYIYRVFFLIKEKSVKDDISNLILSDMILDVVHSKRKLWYHSKVNALKLS